MKSKGLVHSPSSSVHPQISLRSTVLSFCGKQKMCPAYSLDTNSTIYKLDPVLADGLRRVEERLSKAAVPEETKHPVILFKDHYTL